MKFKYSIPYLAIFLCLRYNFVTLHQIMNVVVSLSNVHHRPKFSHTF